MTLELKSTPSRAQTEDTHTVGFHAKMQHWSKNYSAPYRSNVHPQQNLAFLRRPCCKLHRISLNPSGTERVDLCPLLMKVSKNKQVTKFPSPSPRLKVYCHFLIQFSKFPSHLSEHPHQTCTMEHSYESASLPDSTSAGFSFTACHSLATASIPRHQAPHASSHTPQV